MLTIRSSSLPHTEQPLGNSSSHYNNDALLSQGMFQVALRFELCDLKVSPDTTGYQELLAHFIVIILEVY